MTHEPPVQCVNTTVSVCEFVPEFPCRGRNNKFLSDCKTSRHNNNPSGTSTIKNCVRDLAPPARTTFRIGFPDEKRKKNTQPCVASLKQFAFPHRLHILGDPSPALPPTYREGGLNADVDYVHNHSQGLTGAPAPRHVHVCKGLCTMYE